MNRSMVYTPVWKSEECNQPTWDLIVGLLFTHRIPDQELPRLVLLHTDVIFILKILTIHKHVYHSHNDDQPY